MIITIKRHLDLQDTDGALTIIMAVRDELASFTAQYPRITVLVASVLSIGLLCLALGQVFKPVGKRDPKARLPPGPRGVWLLGSLVEFAKHENDDLTPYVIH